MSNVSKKKKKRGGVQRHPDPSTIAPWVRMPRTRARPMPEVHHVMRQIRGSYCGSDGLWLMVGGKGAEELSFFYIPVRTLVGFLYCLHELLVIFLKPDN